MMRMLFLLLCFSAALFGQASSSTAYRLRYGPTMPATCKPSTGDVFFKTTATIGPYYCSAVNTWAAWTGAGGGGDMLGSNNLSELTNTTTARSNLGLVIGTNVQAYDADLLALAAISPSQGDIIYRNASTWVRLAAGDSGKFLQTLGAGANPQWATATGSGTVSSGADTCLPFYSGAGTTIDDINSTVCRFRWDATEHTIDAYDSGGVKTWSLDTDTGVVTSFGTPGPITMADLASIAEPAAGYNNIGPKADGAWYIRENGGTENRLFSESQALITTGTAPTVGAGGCTGAVIGTGSKMLAGTITGTPSATCTVTLTFPVTATTGWSCAISNQTTAALIRQTDSTATIATFVGVTIANDVLRYGPCIAY